MEAVLKIASFKGDQKDKNIKDYELVFVPIIWASHFDVVCFNIKHERVDDWITAVTGMTSALKASMMDG
ncbi:hypothetical protein Hanom_Chr10g00917021 [Helianthus anomalus]